MNEIALLVMTDGRRDMITQTLQSFRENVEGDISCVFVNDDSGDTNYADWLNENFRDLVIDPDVPVLVHTRGARSGFGGAIRNAWRWLADARHSVFSGVDFDWVFHLEDDFTFNAPVDLTRIQNVMIDNWYLAQMALKRQPWGSDLEFANGFMEAKPEWYHQRVEASEILNCWVETRRNWTTNPSLFRADLLDAGWPDDPFSEGKYGFVLKENGLPWGVHPDVVEFGIWGRIEDPPLVQHIGTYRVGDRY